MNTAAVHVEVHVSFRVMDFWGSRPRCGILGFASLNSFLQAFGDCAFYWELPVYVHTDSIGVSLFPASLLHLLLVAS